MSMVTQLTRICGTHIEWRELNPIVWPESRRLSRRCSSFLRVDTREEGGVESGMNECEIPAA